MFNYWGMQYTEKEALRYVTKSDTLYSMTRFFYGDGMSKGLEAMQINNGSGLNFVVLLDRGMDLGYLEYKGIPISYLSATGPVTPQYYESADDQFMRGFLGGMMTTCGLTQVGSPCMFANEQHGQHGRFSYIPAYDISREDGYSPLGEKVMRLKGKIRQAKACAENLLVTRTIEIPIGKNQIIIEDLIENQGFLPSPLMLLYHINIGFPLLNPLAHLRLPNMAVDTMYPQHINEIESFESILAPDTNYHERVFFIKLKIDDNGMSNVFIFNRKDNPSFGMKLSFRNNELPNFALWKQFTPKDYALGLEPCNNGVRGLSNEHKSGNLQYLQAGENIKTYLSLTFFTDEAMCKVAMDE